MAKQTEVIISVRCGAAARSGVNEDNCLILSSVGDPSKSISHIGNGEHLAEISLGRLGCLLVVADGMGGMNAGEVASQIAVETIAELFRSDKLASKALTDENISKFLRLTILEADKAIKEAGARNPDQQGMGTTVAMLWILQDKAYYAWCGDSRIYRYHDETLSQLSSDHSYVCEVLRLSEEDAFNHPDNNIITRSLGNPSEPANPDVAGPEPLHKGDLFLLCSDGLCGVLRNSVLLDDLQAAAESPEKLNEGNLLLWEDAQAHDWHDNVTSVLCYVKSCPQSAGPARPAISRTLDPKLEQTDGGFFRQRKNVYIVGILAAVLILLGIVIGVRKCSKPAKEKVESVMEQSQNQTTNGQTVNADPNTDPKAGATSTGQQKDNSQQGLIPVNPIVNGGQGTRPDLSRINGSEEDKSGAKPAGNTTPVSSDKNKETSVSGEQNEPQSIFSSASAAAAADAKKKNQ